MPRIQKTTATIYIGGNRRCLTRVAAYRHEAIARIAKKYPCDCDSPDHSIGYPGYACDRHSWDTKRWAKLVRRLARFLRFLDRHEREQARDQKALAKALRRDSEDAETRFMFGRM